MAMEPTGTARQAQFVVYIATQQSTRARDSVDAADARRRDDDLILVKRKIGVGKFRVWCIPRCLTDFTRRGFKGGGKGRSPPLPPVDP